MTSPRGASRVVLGSDRQRAKAWLRRLCACAWWLCVAGRSLCNPVAVASDDLSDSCLAVSSVRAFTSADGLPGEDVRALRVVGDRLWVGTTRGLALYEADRFQAWTVRDGLPAPVVSAIAGDTRTGDVWIGTLGGGLVRFTAGRMDRFDQLNSGLAGNLVFDVAVHRGRVFATTNGGLSEYDPAWDTWELHFERRADAPEVALYQLLSADEGLFVAAWRGGLYRGMDANDSWTALRPTPPILGPSPATADPENSCESSQGLLAGCGGTVWWTWRDRIVVREGDGSWRSRKLPRVGEARPFAFDAALGFGALWLATDRGLLRYAESEPHRWCLYQFEAKRPSLTAGELPASARSDVNALEVSTLETAQTGLAAGGLSRPLGELTGIEADPHRGLWIGTDAGLLLVEFAAPPNDLRSVFQVPLPPSSDFEAGSAARHEEACATARILIEQGPAPPSDAPTPGFTSFKQGLPPGIGILGPRARTMTLPGGAPFESPTGRRADLLAVQVALDSHHRRFRGAAEIVHLIADTDPRLRYGWGLPEDDLGEFVGRDDVSAMIGNLSFRNPITELAVLRSRIPFVNAAPLEEFASWPMPPSPWWFPCWDSRRALLSAAFREVAKVHGVRRVLILSGDHWTDQWHARQWLAAARQEGVTEVERGRIEVDRTIRDARTGRPMPAEVLQRFDAVFTWTDVRGSVQILHALRRGEARGILVGSPALLDPASTSLLADFGPTVYAAVPETMQGPRLVEELHKPYAERNVIGQRPVPPDANAVRSFLAADHLLTALRTSGPDRAAVRRALRTDEEGPTEQHAARFASRESFTLVRHTHGTWKQAVVSMDRSGGDPPQAATPKTGASEENDEAK